MIGVDDLTYSFNPKIRRSLVQKTLMTVIYLLRIGVNIETDFVFFLSFVFSFQNKNIKK
jgi:hypothetical protein